MLFFSSCNNNKDEWYPIPENSSLVIKISGNNISRKIASDKLLSLEFTDLFKLSSKDTSIPQDEISQIINTPYKNGIDIFADFYLFKKDSLVGVYASLHDESDFSDLIEEILKKKIDKFQEYHFTFLDKTIVAWDDNTCLFLFKEKFSSTSLQELENILDLKKDNTLFKNEAFKNHLSSSYDITLWFKPNALLDQYVSSPDVKNILNKDYSSAYINFEEGKIDIEASNLLDDKFPEWLKHSIDSSNNQSNFSPTGVFNFNVSKLIDFIHKDSLRDIIQHPQLTEAELAKTFTGKVLFNISGIKQREKQYTTYTYDDDFNKIETTEIQKCYYPEISILIQSKEIDNAEKILNSLAHKNLIEKKNNYHYESILTETTYCIDNSPEGIYINSSKKEIPATASPNHSNKQLQYPFYISIAPNNFSSLFSEEGFNKILINNIESTRIIATKQEKGLIFRSEIIFSNKKQNSLSSIIEIIKNQK